ncbi:MAG: methyltransferase [Oscillospiraceae bacterium]|jgi:16S rRNA (guanine1207-N2)-methyltransferase|nr:methyltransferase [Oscillospiraceae bacterium]
MSHYFTEDAPSRHEVKRIHYLFAGQKFIFTTDTGVFSKDRVDSATDILLRTIPRLNGSLLDMGCGYGCIGIVLAKTYSLQLTQADITQTAVDLTRQNSEDNGVRSAVVKTNCFDGIDGKFDTITINPPIHAGKAVTYRMYEESAEHLTHGGKLYIVTLKKHGAESTMLKLREVFGNCEALYKKNGCYVLSCAK